MVVNRATNIRWHQGHVDRQKRQELLRQKGCTIWLTGLPSSGKSTTAFCLEHALVHRGYLAYVLDGDNVRHGLNANLGFSARDRAENIRRIGEVAKLFADAGVVCITSFISPYRSDRRQAHKIHKAAGLPFIEIFIDTPLSVCENRDPKGLYQRARAGELKGFTGVDDPYEAPVAPALVLRTESNSPETLAEQIIDFLVGSEFLPSPNRH